MFCFSFQNQLTLFVGINFFVTTTHVVYKHGLSINDQVKIVKILSNSLTPRAASHIVWKLKVLIYVTHTNTHYHCIHTYLVFNGK